MAIDNANKEYINKKRWAFCLKAHRKFGKKLSKMINLPKIRMYPIWITKWLYSFTVIVFLLCWNSYLYTVTTVTIRVITF